MIHGGAPFFPPACQSSRSFNTMPANLELPSSTGSSTGRRRAMPCKAGGSRPVPTSYLPGRHRSSSRTGNDFPRIRSTASNCLRIASRYLVVRPDPSCFNCRRTFRLTRILSPKRRYSFEFRHPSWYSTAILRLLKDENISLCISDHHDAPAPWKRTADFVYVRGHGPGGRYKAAIWQRRCKHGQGA